MAIFNAASPWEAKVISLRLRLRARSESILLLKRFQIAGERRPIENTIRPQGL